jgi:PAS domain S-box-containing protein
VKDLQEKLKILMLEDSPSDARLIQHAMKSDGLDFEAKLVDNRDAFIGAVREFRPQLVLSDHSLPSFDSTEALSIAKRLIPHTPFILVTGTVSEEFAVSVIKAGAADYVLKSNLSRLTVSILSAISQQKDRDRLKESEEQFQYTIDGMIEGVQIIGFDWKYLYINNIVALQAKQRKEELLGKTMLEAFPHIAGTEMYEKLRACMEERTYVEMENEFTYPDGSRTWFKLTMQPAPQGVLILSRDITDQKKFINLLETQNHRIKKMNSVLDRFLYSVSHEFRTPICNGLGLINLARTVNEEHDKTDILDKLEFTIRNLDDMLQNIGVFSDISRLELTYRETDIHEVFNDCVQQAQLLGGPHTVDLNIDVKQSVPLFCDRTRLYIVLRNLVSNGIKFRDLRKDNQFVHVNVIVEVEQVKIEVRDNGRGIKEEYLDKIFDVFYKVNSTSEGSGLGLFMVREIVESMGGKFNVQSRYESGTTFFLNFPNGRRN